MVQGHEQDLHALLVGASQLCEHPGFVGRGQEQTWVLGETNAKNAGKLVVCKQNAKTMRKDLQALY